MFEIDIKNTRTRCEICSKITKICSKDTKTFFLLLTFNIYLFHFYCLNDFHYLDHFHCLRDFQKNWNLVYILKLAQGWVIYRFPSAMCHNDAGRWGGITNDKQIFEWMNYCSCITISFSYNYSTINGKRSFINKEIS